MLYLQLLTISDYVRYAGLGSRIQPYFSAPGNAGTALKWVGRTYLREQNEAEVHKT